ncbi:MAG: glycine cleavage system protein GcvH [Alphaproteobacteria bacterium]|nr:glycine cleavage system protein GcvH [Alphaproteobacteria bacterium]
MAEFKYTKDHECVYVEGDIAFIGISKHARDALGDLVYIELPEIGKSVEKGAEVAVVESVKTAAEIYLPVDGVVVAVNEEMAEAFELVSSPVNEKGWIVKVKVADISALDELMNEAAYAEYLKEID